MKLEFFAFTLNIYVKQDFVLLKRILNCETDLGCIFDAQARRDIYDYFRLQCFSFGPGGPLGADVRDRTEDVQLLAGQPGKHQRRANLDLWLLERPQSRH